MSTRSRGPNRPFGSSSEGHFTSRGPVRRIVRPFIKEFKNRSIKPLASHPGPIEAAKNDGSKPSFLDLGVFATRQANYDDERSAALKAADAVFRRSGSAASAPETTPSSNAPAGRILPSLVAAEDVPAVRSADTDEKVRRGRGPGKAEKSSPVRRKKPALQPKSEVARVAVEQPAASSPPELSAVSRPRRERRPIQKRWVFETELIAGRNGSGACARRRADFGLSFIFQATGARI